MDGRKTTFLLGDNFSVAMLNFGGVTLANPPIVVIVLQDSGFLVHVSNVRKEVQCCGSNRIGYRIFAYHNCIHQNQGVM